MATIAAASEHEGSVSPHGHRASHFHPDADEASSSTLPQDGATLVAGGEERVVDATNRGIDDLDLPAWLAFTSVACFTRTFLQYPFLLAMTRRQACPHLERQTSVRLLADMYRSAGGSVRIWWRGFPALGVGMVISECLYMWCFETSRNKRNSPFVPLLGGPEAATQARLDAAAGLLSDATTTGVQVPFTFVSNRQMCAGVGVAASLPYESYLATIRRAVAANGATTLFTGLTPSMLLATHSALWWAVYGEMKACLYERSRPSLDRLGARYPNAPSLLTSPTDNAVLNSASAVVAGTMVAVLWNPVVVVRTRMQVTAPGLGAPPPRMRDVVRQTWMEAGFRGFTRGTCMSIVSTAVDVTVFSFFYELGKQLAQKM